MDDRHGPDQGPGSRRSHGRGVQRVGSVAERAGGEGERKPGGRLRCDPGLLPPDQSGSRETRRVMYDDSTTTSSTSAYCPIKTARSEPKEPDRPILDPPDWERESFLRVLPGRHRGRPHCVQPSGRTSGDRPALWGTGKDSGAHRRRGHDLHSRAGGNRRAPPDRGCSGNLQARTPSGQERAGQWRRRGKR